MGKTQSVKSIIHAMMVYSFHIYQWHVQLLRHIDTWIRNFIWSGDILTKKVCTVSWSKVCAPFHNGGLDIYSVRNVNASLLLKHSWLLIATLRYKPRNPQRYSLIRRLYHHITSSLIQIINTTCFYINVPLIYFVIHLTNMFYLLVNSKLFWYFIPITVVDSLLIKGIMFSLLNILIHFLTTLPTLLSYTLELLCVLDSSWVYMWNYS